MEAYATAFRSFLSIAKQDGQQGACCRLNIVPHHKTEVVGIFHAF